MMLTLAATLLLAASAIAIVRASWIAAQPDQWLLRVRNGRVVDAGIGIRVWRLPGDVVARFSSTVQRVRFTAEALSAEHLALVVDGFLLWSVAPDAEKAFRAFSKLGIANLDRAPLGLKSPAHLLTSSQHHAFQALLGAEVRAEASTLSLAELLAGDRRLVRGLEERLGSLSQSLGIDIERIEIQKVEPADGNLLRDLSARSEESVREEAARARLEAAARLRQRQAAESKREAAETAEVRLAKVEGEKQVAELELSMALDRKRRMAEGERDAAVALLSVEEQKSQAVRDHELAKFTAEQAARAMASWRIREGKWIQFGRESPVAAVTEILVGMKELVSPAGKN